MKNYISLFFVYFLLATPIAISITPGSIIELPQASAEDFRSVLGTHIGTLGYKDYSGGNWVNLDLVGVSYITMDKFVIEHLIYEGKVYRQKYEFNFKGGKVSVNGETMTLQENTFNQETNQKMVLTQRGKDGNKNRKCTFRHTISYENNQLTILKEVKFDDEQDFFKRNMYTLQHP
jgi:hypothetical protein